MPSGGKRPGAGRKPSGTNRRIPEIAERAAAEGITPLEVMLEAMRDAHSKGNLGLAAGYAKDAAPYMHSKYSSVEMGGRGGGPVRVAIVEELVDADGDADEHDQASPQATGVPPQ